MEKSDFMNKVYVSEKDFQNITNETLQNCCRQMVQRFDKRDAESLEQCNQLYRQAFEKVKQELADEPALFHEMELFVKVLVDGCMLNGFKLPVAALNDIIALGERLAENHPEIHLRLPEWIESRHNNLYSEDLEESARHIEDYRQMFGHYQAADENDGLTQRKAIDCLARIVNVLSMSELPGNHIAAKMFELEILEYIDSVLSHVKHSLLRKPKEDNAVEIMGKKLNAMDFVMFCPEHTEEEIQERMLLIDQMKEKYPYAAEFLDEVGYCIRKKRVPMR